MTRGRGLALRTAALAMLCTGPTAHAGAAGPPATGTGHQGTTRDTAPSACAADETTVFACAAAHGRQIAVCASGALDASGSPGTANTANPANTTNAATTATTASAASAAGTPGARPAPMRLQYR